jgi:hypothetical protein
MSWESPKLSKQDIELITVTLDDYIFYAKQDGIEYEGVEKIWLRLNDHLQKF